MYRRALRRGIRPLGDPELHQHEGGDTVPYTLTMASKMRAADVLPDDVIETRDGCTYRVTDTTPSASGKIVKLRTVVQSSNDSELAVGRTMEFGRRAGTLVLVHRA